MGKCQGCEVGMRTAMAFCWRRSLRATAMISPPFWGYVRPKWWRIRTTSLRVHSNTWHGVLPGDRQRREQKESDRQVFPTPARGRGSIGGLSTFSKANTPMKTGPQRPSGMPPPFAQMRSVNPPFSHGRLVFPLDGAWGGRFRLIPGGAGDAQEGPRPQSINRYPPPAYTTDGRSFHQRGVRKGEGDACRASLPTMGANAAA